jgi:hypothetical protein
LKNSRNRKGANPIKTTSLTLHEDLLNPSTSDEKKVTDKNSPLNVELKEANYYNILMKQKTFAYLLFILLLTYPVSPRDTKNTFQDLQGPYFGQKAPEGGNNG